MTLPRLLSAVASSNVSRKVMLHAVQFIIRGGQMPDQHLFDTVRFLLSYQNGDGGWATYENNRGWSWYELMNPSEASVGCSWSDPEFA